MISAATKTYPHLCEPLTANGYPIIPVVEGEKRPAIRDWTEYTHTAAAAQRFPSCGVGILTGQVRDNGHAICAIDVDITDARIAESIVEEILNRFGEGLVRVGEAPKSLILYRAEKPGIPKRTSKSYTHGRIEVMGHGQQIVAYGTHPKTKKPYEWVGILGGPEEISAFDLPVITEGDITGIIALYETMMQTAGFSAITPGGSAPVVGSGIPDALDVLSPAVGLDIQTAEAHLSQLSPDDRTTWLNAGMALHHEFSGSQNALNIWDEWSAKSPKYVEGETDSLWAGFGRHSGARREITALWLVKHASEIKRTRESEQRHAAMNLLIADIDTCTDYDLLTGQIAPRIAAEGYDVGARLIITKKLRDRFAVLSGVKLTAKELDRMISSGHYAGTECTEVGNAQRLLEKYGDNLMYCPENTQWYRWDKSRWGLCVREVVLRMAEKTVEGIKQEASKMEDEKKKAGVYSWYLSSQRAVMLDNMIKLAQKDRAVMRYTREIDADTNYIGVLNGAVYLKTGDLIPPDKKLCITHNTGIEYNPEATAPIFEQTVNDAFFGDNELVSFLKRIVGYSLLGQPEREEIVVIPEGRGANGKSTIFNAIHHALGSYARYTSADTFVNARQAGSGSGAREDVLRLMGARFVYVTELEENGVMRESFIKSMTGGEAIPARGLYSKHTIEIPPTWIAFMPTNHLPIIKGEDKGIWRKICVLPFHRDFTSDPDIVKDVDRKTKLKAELPGILRWCVEGCIDYQSRGLDIPQSIKSASEEYRAEMDLLSDWLNTCCELSPGYAQSNSELWSSWEAFAKKDGLLTLISSANSLSRRLTHRGFKRIKNINGVTGRGFSGIRLKGSGEEF